MMFLNRRLRRLSFEWCNRRADAKAVATVGELEAVDGRLTGIGVDGPTHDRRPASLAGETRVRDIRSCTIAV
jgi:hypothetical protein